MYSWAPGICLCWWKRICRTTFLMILKLNVDGIHVFTKCAWQIDCSDCAVKIMFRLCCEDKVQKTRLQIYKWHISENSYLFLFFQEFFYFFKSYYWSAKNLFFSINSLINWFIYLYPNIPHFYLRKQLFHISKFGRHLICL